MIIAVLAAFGRDYTPQEIENPNVADRRVYVADPGNLVSSDVKERVNGMLYDLRRQTSAEVAVVVVPSIGDIPIEDFTEQVFTRWGLGKSDRDNGVMILIALDQKRARIQTGYGAEGALPDISVKKIIDRDIVANMREGNLDAAVEASAADVAAVLSDPAIAEEMRSGEKDVWESQVSTISNDDLMSFIGYVALAFGLIAIVMLVIDLRNARGRDRYHKSMVWYNHRTAYWVLAVCSLGIGLIPAFLSELFYRRARNKPLKCSVCGAKMRKLNEQEDNQLLSPSQDFEEQINTVDYDVWECPQCGSVERFPFRTKQMKYTECPNCHTIAMCLVHDHTVVPPTTRRNGEGEKVYECQYCHFQNRRRYSIPKRDDGTGAALAAGAILGSLGRGGGGGGGGFGGGFGGGSTGGGGASGGW